MAKHRWLYAWGLGSVAAGAASLLLPLYIVGLGASPLELGLLGAVAAFIGAPGALLWGRLADRTQNPQGIVTASLVGVAVVLCLVPVLTSIPVLILLNAVLWLVFAAAGPVLTLDVVAGVPESEWNHEIALLNKYQGYGWAGGLLLGILWTATVGRFLTPDAAQGWLFVFSGVAAAVAAVLIRRWMPAPNRHKLSRIDPERVARLLSTGRRGVRSATFAFNPNRLYWSTRGMHPRRLADRFTPTLATYFLAVVLFFTGFAAFFAPLPLYLTDAGFSGEMVFALYLVSSLGSAVFYTAAGRLSSRFDLRLLQAGSLGVRAVAMPLVAVASGAFAAGLTGSLVVGALFALIGLSWSVIAVTAGTIVTRVAPREVRGEALGVYAALSTLAGGLGSLLGGSLADVAGFTLAFAAAGVVILVGALLVVSLDSLSAGARSVTRPTPQSGEQD